MDYRPHKVVWELTNACNAKCIHCGSESGSQRENELNLDEVLDVCDQLRDLDCRHVTLIGGECFLSPYWKQVCQRLVENGIRVTPLSNGLLINEANIQTMVDLGLKGVSISIDGLEEKHDYIRGVPGLFQKVIKNLKHAQQAGLAIGVNTSISKVNLTELPGLADFLTNLGIRIWQIQIVEDIGKASENKELKLTLKDLYELAKYVADFRQRQLPIKIIVGDNVGFYASFEPMIRDHPFTGCPGGRFTLGIESNGNIRGCLSVLGTEANTEGNVRQRSLKDIWNDPQLFAVYRQRTVDKLTGFCASCEFKNLCRAGCSSLAFALTGSFYENPFCLHKYEVEEQLIDNRLAN